MHPCSRYVSDRSAVQGFSYYPTKYALISVKRLRQISRLSWQMVLHTLMQVICEVKNVVHTHVEPVGQTHSWQKEKVVKCGRNC